jgi:ATP-dependent Clp protease ATP-binding subunit ClpC
MFDRFTDRAKKVMSFARQEAMKFNHEYIGTEHILLGLVQEGSGVAANVLKNMTIDLEKIRHEVEKIVKTGPSMVTMGQLPFTPRAEEGPRAVARGGQPAEPQLHRHRAPAARPDPRERGIAAQVLMNLGVKLDEVRDEVLEFLGASESNNEDEGESSESPGKRQSGGNQGNQPQAGSSTPPATARARRPRSTRSAATSPTSRARASWTRSSAATARSSA